MRFHCSGETPVLAGCCRLGWGWDGAGMGPNAAPCPQLLPAHPGSCRAGPCPPHPFGELPCEGSPHSGIPSPRQPISGTLRLGSINNTAILSSLSGQLSSCLMLGWCQVSLREDEDEDEDGLAAPVKLAGYTRSFLPSTPRCAPPVGLGGMIWCTFIYL